MRRPFLAFSLTVAALAGACAPALATPVASTEQEAQVLGRVFPEPLVSTNYIQFARPGGGSEFADGIRLLAKEYPRYLKVSTVAQELGDPRAVSTGPDGVPAGRTGDTGDGKPFQVMQVTDTSVPDKGKQYAVLMFAHSLEPCGREGVIRSVEDLLRATKDPSVVYSDGTGAGGEHRYSAAELLKRVKVFVVATSPDGWAKGDVTSRYDQSTGGGLNSNRVAWQPGWVFQTKTLADHGYRTATEPEGLANGRYLEQVRRAELGGRPFTTGLDVHGPLPTALVLGADRGISPAALKRVTDLGERDRRAMDGVLQAYAGQAGSAGYQQVTEQLQGYRDAVRRLTPGIFDPIGGLAPPSGGSGLNATVNTAGDYPLRWATEGGVFDGIGYDASSTWAGFMSGQLGAASITIEANCVEMAPYVPASMQLYVDNVRAAVRTTLAATAAAGDPEPQRDLGGRVGFFDDGRRVTDRDGNPSPVPDGFPGAPLQQQQAQEPYDVKPTDYFRDLPEITVQRPRRVRGPRLHRELPRLSTLVVADQHTRQTKRLAAWVRKGGNLVLTDSALRLLPRFGIGTDDDVRRDFGYVGYADFDRTAALAKGLPARARETFDPVGLGMPLLMERDGYWHCNTGESPGCASGTLNSAPIWTLPTAVVRAVPGAQVAGTVDPPATRRTTREGTRKDRAEVFTIPYGKGRIVALGALLPTPSEALPHPFGLLGYTITTAAQEVLLRAMTWKGPQVRRLARPLKDHRTPPAPTQTRATVLRAGR